MYYFALVREMLNPFTLAYAKIYKNYIESMSDKAPLILLSYS